MGERRKSKSPRGIFDIPIKTPCPQCGELIEIELKGFDKVREVICRHCARHLPLSDKWRTKILAEHGQFIRSLQKRFS